MANGSLLSLAVGDRVVYPNQGVCRVFAVEALEISGQKLTFVTMKREEDGAVVRVPEAKVQAIRLRKVATAQEVAKIFEYLGVDSDRADLDWKQRARTNVLLNIQQTPLVNKAFRNQHNLKFKDMAISGE